MSLLIFIGIGIAAGFLAGKIMKGKGFGLLMNLVFGVGGAFLGKFLAGILGFSSGNLIGQLAVATGGAILIILIINKLKK